MSTPLLSGIVVHWHNEAELARLLAAWPRDPRFELVVVDNGSSRPPVAEWARWIVPGANLGFGGAANLGATVAQAPILLMLNPDACPEPGALEALLEGFAALPEMAGLAPRLLGDDGSPQFAWQLRRLPRLFDLFGQAFFLSPRLGPEAEPAPGARVEQPAAAALALRREALEAVGGFDARFFPAWFEDVDLAVSLRKQGLSLRYWPAAVFRHGLGASVSQLGYGPFLWVYQRNLRRYAAKHFGRHLALVLSCLLPLGLVLRLLALPLRKPQRAASRRAAAHGLLKALAGALSGWRWPRDLARRFAGPLSVEEAP